MLSWPVHLPLLPREGVLVVLTALRLRVTALGVMLLLGAPGVGLRAARRLGGVMT